MPDLEIEVGALLRLLTTPRTPLADDKFYTGVSGEERPARIDAHQVPAMSRVEVGQ